MTRRPAAFVVLDALDGAPVTLRALSARTGLPLTTVHRAVAKLLDWGALERTQGGVRPGLKLFELGQLVHQRMSLRERALPLMGDLYEATHEVVSLAILDGAETVWVEQLAGRLAPPVPSRVGGRLAAHVTAAGKALLAYAPRETLDTLALERHGPGTITDPERLRAELETIRETGIAINREESRAGVLGVAAPVFAHGAPTPVAALALAVARRSRNRPEAMAPAVRTAALTLGRALA